MTTARPIAFGDYLLLERIGFGSTAEVFRAVRRGRHPGEAEVAVKRLLPPLAEDPAVVRMFLREVGALARIDHPNVVALLAQGEAAGIPHLVMPWLDGATLRSLLARPLPQPLALHVAAEVAAGLHAAHREGIVHRDVSPTNVQVTLEGQVIVLDFGIARVAGLAQTTRGGALRGKWAYLSPEQIAGEALDGRSDLFALGSVLVEMLTGEPPFQGTDPHDTMARIQAADTPKLPDVPAPLRDLLARLLARRPMDRPDDGASVATALRALLPQDLDIQSQLIGLVQQVPARRGRTDDAAELRGEQVTDPALDPDVTQVRLGGDHALA